jgi:protease-4
VLQITFERLTEGFRMQLRFSLALLVSSFVLAGCGMPSLLITPVGNTSKIEEIQVESGQGFSPSKVAVIELEGMLANTKTGGLLQPTENKLSLFTQQLQQAENDPKVKAVVLRVNSPGGTVTCSDTMYEMVKEFRARTHKPVITSGQEVMASGAYYTACASDVIMVQPTTVVGSIGVIFETLDASNGLAKLGLRFDSIKSGALKDMGSPFKPLDPAARDVMQGMVDAYYGRFLNVVKTNRPNLPADAEKVKMATDGRVFSGEQALALGLVDKLGRLDNAIALAKEMSKSPNAKVVMYKRPYGYSGSIYADSSVQPPRANVLTLDLPESDLLLPKGFYYLWRP